MEKIETHKYAYDYAYSVEAWVKQEIYKDFFLATPKFDWSTSRTCSRGGYYADGPSVNIAMYGAYKNYKGEIYRFIEYASFDADKVQALAPGPPGFFLGRLVVRRELG